MSKKSDLVFDNVEEFLKNNPQFSITKPVPNTAAIRAVLRAGGAIDGVKLVETAKVSSPEAASDTAAATQSESSKAEIPTFLKKQAE